MMNNIKKIKNIKAVNTVDKINSEWLEVLSKRNKLLQDSDWTQLEDVTMDSFVKKQWREWRQKLRNVSKKNNSSLEQIKYVIDLLEKERPIIKKIDETLFHQLINIPETEIINNSIEQKTNLEHQTEINLKDDDKVIKEKIIEKVFLKEIPLIIREELSEEKIKEKFFLIFSENHMDLYNFLKDTIKKVPNVIILDSDDLETIRNKTKEYLIAQKIYLFELKTKESNPIIIDEKYQQALDFLTSENVNIVDYPLIELHSQLLNYSAEKIANLFIEEKKSFNKIILESEKFLLYNMRKIDMAETIDQLKTLILDIKNGY